jgi:uncharacterized protein (DUF983 family)
MQSRLASLEPPAPCARGRQRAPGVKWGDLCPACLAELRRRASPLARIISLLCVGAVVWFAFARLPLTMTVRIWVAAIAIATYFLVRRIVTQIAVEVLKGRTDRWTDGQADRP